MSLAASGEVNEPAQQRRCLHIDPLRISQRITALTADSGDAGEIGKALETAHIDASWVIGSGCASAARPSGQTAGCS